MSLGQLPTIAEQAPANFYHFVLDNEVYATTGGQPVPNARRVDYAAMARAAGYPTAVGFSELDEAAHALPGLLSTPGPVFVALKVWPEVENTPIGQRVRWRKRVADTVVRDLRSALVG
jgi:thiamine pyrophosphate-dependent acetolactate synthase large subunit-like protein